MPLTTRSNSYRRLASVVALTVACLVADVSAQTATPQRPRQTKPQPSRPAIPKPAPPAAKPDTKPPEPIKPPTPPPEDVRFKSVYTTGDQRTETVTFIKGQRERFEFQDMVLLKQHDQKRTIQISRAANTYLVAPDGMPVAAARRRLRRRAPPGVDDRHHHHRRHRRTEGRIRPAGSPREDDDRQAADARRVRHVQAAHRNRRLVHRRTGGTRQPASGRTRTGAPFPATAPIRFRRRSTATPRRSVSRSPTRRPSRETTASPSVATMDVTEFELTTLDAALFEIPPGLNAAMNSATCRRR